MQIPYITLGGSDKATMLDDLIDAREALRKAREALAKTAPNSRDYLKPNVSFTTAAHEHQARIRIIETLEYELLTLAEGIDAK